MSFYSSVRAALLLLFLSATSAFAADSPETTMPQGPRILTLGDSMIAWHSVSKNSIADALAETLGEPVENRAIGGARIIYGLPITGAMGMLNHKL